MIHIIHTPAATLARHRMRLAARCSLGVAAFAFCLAVLASQASILQPTASGCDFTGVPFYPAENAPPPEKSRHPLPQASASMPDLPQLPDIHPLGPSATGELAFLDETESDAELTIETDASALLLSPATPAPAKTKTATAEKPESCTPPDYLSCPRPPYPLQLKQRRLQGRIEILIHISPAGHPTEVEITTSSGNSQLDCHTRSWIMLHWRFRPAYQGTKPVAARVRTSITYSLHS